MAAMPDITEQEIALEMQGLAHHSEQEQAANNCRLTVSRRDLDDELGEQSRKLFIAEAMVESVAQALQTQFGYDWPDGVPDYRRVLREAGRHIRGAYENLEVMALEHNAEIRAPGGES